MHRRFGLTLKEGEGVFLCQALSQSSASGKIFAFLPRAVLWSRGQLYLLAANIDSRCGECTGKGKGLSVGWSQHPLPLERGFKSYVTLKPVLLILCYTVNMKFLNTIKKCHVFISVWIPRTVQSSVVTPKAGVDKNLKTFFSHSSNNSISEPPRGAAGSSAHSWPQHYLLLLQFTHTACASHLPLAPKFMMKNRAWARAAFGHVYLCASQPAINKKE